MSPPSSRSRSASYVGKEQKLVAWHRVASQVNYVSTPGNHAADTPPTRFAARFTQYAWPTNLSVDDSSAQSVVAIGDSITDGMRSTPQREPALARRAGAAVGGEGRAGDGGRQCGHQRQPSAEQLAVLWRGGDRPLRARRAAPAGRARDRRADRHQRYQFRRDARARRPRLRHPHTQVTADALIRGLSAADRAGAPARHQDIWGHVDAGVTAAGAGKDPACGERVDPFEPCFRRRDRFRPRAARSGATGCASAAVRQRRPHPSERRRICGDGGARFPSRRIASRASALSAAKNICRHSLVIGSGSTYYSSPRFQNEGRGGNRRSPKSASLEAKAKKTC